VGDLARVRVRVRVRVKVRVRARVRGRIRARVRVRVRLVTCLRREKKVTMYESLRSGSVALVMASSEPYAPSDERVGSKGRLGSW
jgi:hypothetical protein